jgi:hypothetical protein
MLTSGQRPRRPWSCPGVNGTLLQGRWYQYVGWLHSSDPSDKQAGFAVSIVHCTVLLFIFNFTVPLWHYVDDTSERDVDMQRWAAC